MQNAKIVSKVTHLVNALLGGRERNSTAKCTIVPSLNLLFEQVEEDEKGNRKLKSKLKLSVKGERVARFENQEPTDPSDLKPAASSQESKKSDASNINQYREESTTDVHSPILTEASKIDKQEESELGQRSVEHGIPRNNLFSPFLNESCIEAKASEDVSKLDNIVHTGAGEPIQASPSVTMSQIVSPNYPGYENYSIILIHNYGNAASITCV